MGGGQDQPDGGEDDADGDRWEVRAIAEQGSTHGGKADDKERFVRHEQERLRVTAAPAAVPASVGPHSASSPSSGGIQARCSPTASRRYASGSGSPSWSAERVARA